MKQCHEKGKAHIKHFERKKGGENNLSFENFKKKKVKRPFINDLMGVKARELEYARERGYKLENSFQIRQK